MTAGPHPLYARWFPGARIERDEDWLPYADLGSGVSAAILFARGAPASLLLRHDRPGGEPCEGAVNLDPHRGAAWSIERDGPLTLSPSIVCTACGVHGWIREGRWVPA